MKDYMIVPCLEFKVEESKESMIYLVSGLASTYNNIDLGMDRVIPGFFTEDLQKQGNERPALWQHYASKPIGVNVYIDTPEGLQFTASLPMDDSFVKQRVIPQIRIKSVKAASIGYKTEISRWNKESNCRDLVKGKLLESSFVTFPMNPKAVILSVSKHLQLYSKGDLKAEDNEIGYLQQFAKNVGMEDFALKGYMQGFDFDNKAVPPYKNYALADESMEWDKKKAVSQIREHTGSKDEPSKNYKNGFMYFDPENVKEFTAYKLPYVYYIDGNFKAVPRALSAIVGALAGARGGLKVPVSDKDEIKTQINKYYKKMGREEPFKKGGFTFIDSFDIKHIENRDIDKIFDDNVILSSSVKSKIADLLCSKVESGKADGNSDLINELRETLKSFGG